ncbi:MAG: DUF1456 family protein [Bdellovibrionota bacterium]
MIHNDVLRSVRYMLNLRDINMSGIWELAGPQIPLEKIQQYLKSEDDPGFVACPEEVMAQFLDGMIYFRRGKDPARPPMAVELPVTNNIVLKKLRVAFELKEEDIVAVLRQAGFEVSGPELSAFFRRPGHPNYRECGDQYLRNFLKGLSQSAHIKPKR